MTGAKFCDFEKMAAIFLKYWDKYLIDGVSYTLLLSAITVLGGVVFASLLALMKMSKVAPLRWLSTIYIEVIRGTPMLLQLYFFYFGLPMLIPALKSRSSCVLPLLSSAIVPPMFRRLFVPAFRRSIPVSGKRRLASALANGALCGSLSCRRRSRTFFRPWAMNSS